jgi:small subunit ribosomal protein S20
MRRFTDALRDHDLNSAEERFRAAAKKLDQVAAKGTIHPNAAARRKSRAQKRLNALRNATKK